MELRQLRYFVRTVELKSMGRAAVDLELSTSTLSQQISQLESELSTRLLTRRSTGVFPTEAGLEFWHHAQTILRQVDVAAAAAQKGRLSGRVTVGLASTTAAVLALPFVEAMQASYPTVGVRIVEGLTSHLQALLDSRQLDLAVLFETGLGTRWSVTPLVEEQLFLIGRPNLQHWPAGFPHPVTMRQLCELPLVMPGAGHALRMRVERGFEAVACQPCVVLEIDGVHSLMNAVRAGYGATIQPGSLVSGTALARGDLAPPHLQVRAITDPDLRRRSMLASLSDDELSPAGLAARVVIGQTAWKLTDEGKWLGASRFER